MMYRCTMYDVPMYSDKRPNNNDIKRDMLLIDKEARKICLIEGTICGLGGKEIEANKYSEIRKSLESLNCGYEIDQINVVFDILSKTSDRKVAEMGTKLRNY